jgi:hypothetical protein
MLQNHQQNLRQPTRQFAGNPYRITERRSNFILKNANFLEADQKLKSIIEKYNCKYCNVTADSKGRVNIKFKIIKRIYFFSKEENFLKSVNKLQFIVDKYIQERRANLLKSYLLSED